MENEELKEAVKNLAYEWHRTRYGLFGLMTFKTINMPSKGKIKLIYEVEDQLFMIETEMGLPGQKE